MVRLPEFFVKSFVTFVFRVFGAKPLSSFREGVAYWASQSWSKVADWHSLSCWFKNLWKKLQIEVWFKLDTLAVTSCSKYYIMTMIVIIKWCILAKLRTSRAKLQSLAPQRSKEALLWRLESWKQHTRVQTNWFQKLKASFSFCLSISRSSFSPGTASCASCSAGTFVSDQK